MSLTFMLFCCIVLCLGCLKVISLSKRYPPGPFQWPIIGNVFLLKRLCKRFGGLHVALEFLAERYNNTRVLALRLGSENVVVVFGKDIVRKVLLDNNFTGRPRNFFLKLRCFDSLKGITCTDGDLWYTQRQFLLRNLRKLGFGKSEMHREIQQESLMVLSELDQNHNLDRIDLKPFLQRAIFNILWTIVTGEKITKNNEEKIQGFFTLMDKRSKVFDMSGGLLNYFPWLRFIFPEYVGYNLIKSLNSDLKKYINNIIEKHTMGTEQDDLISLYLKEMTSGTKNFTYDQMMVVILDLFIAGSQTTTNTLRFALLMMAVNCEVQNRVYQELKQVYDSVTDIQFSDKLKTPYTEAVISETMRLYHVTPIIGPRRVLNDTEFEGYFIPKDSTILISMHSVHKDKDIWTNVNDFVPERFLVNEPEPIMTFGLGKRRCLGETLAKNCIYTLFATILYTYKIEQPNGCSLSTTPLPGITLSPQDYVLSLKKR